MAAYPSSRLKAKGGSWKDGWWGRGEREGRVKGLAGEMGKRWGREERRDREKRKLFQCANKFGKEYPQVRKTNKPEFKQFITHRAQVCHFCSASNTLSSV